VEGVVGALEIKEHLANLFLVQLICCFHLVQGDQPVSNLDFALPIWRKRRDLAQTLEEVRQAGMDVVNGSHVESKGIHQGDEVLHRFGHGSSVIGGFSCQDGDSFLQSLLCCLAFQSIILHETLQIWNGVLGQVRCHFELRDQFDAVGLVPTPVSVLLLEIPTGPH